MTSLIQKLRDATSGSRELDREIAEALGWHVWDRSQSAINSFGMHGGPADGLCILRSGKRPCHLPKWSTSLDSIIGLIEEKLPNVRWSISRYGSAFLHNVGPYYEMVPAEHKSPAIALCLALLSALEGES